MRLSVLTFTALLATGSPLLAHAQSSEAPANPPATSTPGETAPGSRIPIAHHHVEIPLNQPDVAGRPIHIGDLSSIEEWRKGGDRTVYIRDDKGQWYKLALVEACMKLDTSGGLTFITEVGKDSSKVSYVDVAHHQCRITSISEVDAPPH